MRPLACVVLSFLSIANLPASPPRISSHGVRLPGCQLASDTGFDFLDCNGDGKLERRGLP